MSDTLFTDGQLGVVVACATALGTGLGALARWAITRVTKSMDASTESRIKQGEAFSVLSTKVDGIADQVADVAEWCAKTPTGRRAHTDKPKS